MSVVREQPVLPVADSERYGAVKESIHSSFAAGQVAAFLKSLGRKKLRIRDFEAVLNARLLGASTADNYSRLRDSDRAQIRELYLALLEQVAPELRQKFFRLYAYY